MVLCDFQRNRWLVAFLSSLLGFFLSTQIAQAGLEEYSTLIVADPPDAKQRPGTVRVTYLGVNGYQFEANGHALLVDPYFTRVGLTSIVFQQRLEPNDTRIEFGLQRVRGARRCSARDPCTLRSFARCA